MPPLRRMRSVLVLLVLASSTLAFGPCQPYGFGLPSFHFRAPLLGQLSEVGPLEFVLRVPAFGGVEDLRISVDEEPLDPESWDRGHREVRGPLEGLQDGKHHLRAELDLRIAFLFQIQLEAATWFDLAELENAAECDVLNNATCLLPYPSSRFLEPADTPTGWRLAFPASGIPPHIPDPISVEPFLAMDGYAPMQAILMHFPAGVDVEASAAPRLLSETRTTDLRSLDPDSPTVLLDADTGERILHFAEVDATAEDVPDRQVLFLRPGKSLEPGHRYIVAVRNLVSRDGSAVEAEPPFAALRDGRPTTIESLESRRSHFRHLFRTLRRAGVPRRDLVLAFDFVVRSRETAAGDMLEMRDQTFDWLEEREASGEELFQVDSVQENDCSDSGFWRIVSGSFKVPLYLTSDPLADPLVPGTLTRDEAGRPQPQGITNPPFTIGIPCSVLSEDAEPIRPVLLGHGSYGSGAEMVALWDDLYGRRAEEFELGPIAHIVGGTDWWGESSLDTFPNLYTGFLIRAFIDGNDFLTAVPDRLRQGLLNTLVLGRMMKRGLFNGDEAFRTPADEDVFPGPEEELYYSGISLGGYMGQGFGALSPDVDKLQFFVGGTYRAGTTPRNVMWPQFQFLIHATFGSDPITTSLGMSLTCEMWGLGGTDAYTGFVTGDPLPGSDPKPVLMTQGLFDNNSPDIFAEMAARTMGIPSLVGSILPERPLIPDVAGPAPSAIVFFDTGFYDPGNPAHQPLIPPLANLPTPPNDCNPHKFPYQIPAAVHQMFEFFQPGGEVVNFCDGLCDAGDPFEQPIVSCDPLGSGG